MIELFKGMKDFDDDISCWDVSNITNMRDMFMLSGALNFNQSIRASETGKVTNMSCMFCGASKFNKAYIKNWQLTKTTSRTVPIMPK